MLDFIDLGPPALAALKKILNEGKDNWPVGAALPLALTTVLTALELLVALLQAYVFAILTCIYLNDAVHPGH